MAVSEERLPWILSPLVLVRVPVLPFTALQGATMGASLAAHAALVERRAERARCAYSLADRLAALVPSAAQEQRSRLIRLRRAVFNGRVGAALDEARGCVLDPPVATLLDRFRAAAEACDAALRERDRLFERECVTTAARQLELLAQPNVRLALELSCPRLVAALDTQRAQAGEPDKRGRQALRRGAAYLWRSAYKPIPCSYFAGTARGRMVDKDDPDAGDLAQRRAVVQADRPILAGIAAWLLRRPDLRGRATVRLAAGAAREPDGIVVHKHSGSPALVTGHEALFAYLAALPGRRGPFSDIAARFGDAELDSAIDAGVIELDVGASETTVDDLEVLTSRIRAVTPRPAELSAMEARLTSYQRVVTQIGAACSPRVADPREADDLRALVHEDSYIPREVPLPLPRLRPFLSEVARYGGALLRAAALPEELALGALFDALSPHRDSLPLPTFHRAYRARCDALGLGADHWANGARLVDAWGVAQLERDPAAPVRAALDRALAAAARGEGAAFVWPQPDELATFHAGARRRLALRFTAAPSGGRFFITLWGSDRMSLLPRYSTLPLGGGAPLDDVRAWMARWPDLADIFTAGGNPDIRPRVTRRVIAGPGARVEAGDHPLSSLWVARDPDTGRLSLRDAPDGDRVCPAFLGVSAPDGLPPIVQLMLHLGGSAPSYLDLLYREIHASTIERVAGCPTPVALPEILLGDHIQISPAITIFPRAAWAEVSSLAGRGSFFRILDWLASNGVSPGVVQARPLTGKRDAQWLDLRHPEAIHALLRLAANADALALMDGRPPEHASALRDGDAAYCAEIYVELEIGRVEEPGEAALTKGSRSVC